jgi:uncharacterized protein YqcC (DUF446 family)
MTDYLVVNDQLIRLKEKLKAYQYWQETPPSEAALASQLPFALDTLSATEWLQWIFIEKMHFLIHSQAALPTNMAIAPYIENAMQGMNGCDELSAICRYLDDLLKTNLPD